MKQILFIAFIISALTSCKILDPSIMLKTPEGYEFSQIPDSVSVEYRLAANDIITFRMYSNDGFKLIDLVANQKGGTQSQNLQFAPPYQIEFDGTSKLPVLGRTQLAGLTLREAELFLEKEFSKFYNSPYIILNVSNKRVIVFPGKSGNATVVPLVNANVTLLETLALVGGLGGDAKAHQIKVIRGGKENPKVYLIDLSTIDGIKDGNMVMQANDIVYVEPRVKKITEVLNEVRPLITLLSTATSLVSSLFTIIVYSKLIAQ